MGINYLQVIPKSQLILEWYRLKYPGAGTELTYTDIIWELIQAINKLEAKYDGN